MELAKIIPKDGPNINEVEKYINKYESEVIVIKCGGSVLLEKKLFNQFIEDISIINKIGLSAIVVHGGGKNIKKKLDENNIETRFVKGLRVSDERTIHHIEEALLDLNIEIIQELKSKKSNVCSISPRDNNIINIVPENEELGYVGIPKKINKEKILKLINNQQIPIVAPLGLGDDEKVYNINADVAAGSIAKELNARRLLLMTDVEGVLDENQNLISEINLDLANEMLKNNIITGGMIPKINTCLDAISNGVKGVVIVDGRKPHSILYELFSDKGAGTLIKK
ncbi:acetylglutamate kinase [Candidatus Pelagibacter sp.]|nr:acetylglutamate kinase [Candidatus Pelagibacter sp.]